MLASILESPEPMRCPASECRVTLKQVVSRKRHVAGVSQIQTGLCVGGRFAVSAARENNCCLSLSEGRRGVQDCNCFSH